jgi:hypothetical protein
VRAYSRRVDEFSHQLQEFDRTISESRAPEWFRKQRAAEAESLAKSELKFERARQSALTLLEASPSTEPQAGAHSLQLSAMCRTIHDADSALRLAQYYVRYYTASARGIAGEDRFVAIVEFMLDHRLLPSAWLHGVLFVHSRANVRGSFLMGDVSATGWWYYFPLAILFKMPLGTMLLLVGAIVAGTWLVNTRRATTRGGGGSACSGRFRVYSFRSFST